ncbi:MAG: sulfurtransferase TusA family protein [Candidatus Bathyarchaeota archaeon]
MKPDHTVDCIGLYCPIPILKTREALDKMEVGQILELVSDDPAAEEDMKYFARTTGHELLESEKIEGGIRFLIKKTG